MRIFGREIMASKSKQANGMLAPVNSRGTWSSFIGWIQEPFSGAWQQDQELKCEDALAFSAVYACITLIAADIGKLRIKLVQQDGNIWKETTSAAFSPVLRKPNRYQNHIQFKEWWITSKLSRGNAYVLKERDNRGIVTSLYVLDPQRCLPLVAPDGSVYYQLGEDNLAGLKESSITVPASEIIHDRMNCLYHPLVGISPLYACGLAAQQGLAIQKNSAHFFRNMSQPGGMLTAPGAISQATADRLKATWNGGGYSGTNAGKVAVAGDGLEFKPFAMSATDAQLIEQLKMTAETVCSTFHVPAYKVGVGAMPAYNNIEALNQMYYAQCLQSLIEAMELCLDEGLSMPATYGPELDLDGLLRMDTATQAEVVKTLIGAAVLSPNEARERFGRLPVTGGDSPMIQQQNYSLGALAKRDAQADPFGTAPAPALPAPEPDQTDKALHYLFRRSPESLAHV